MAGISRFTDNVSVTMQVGATTPLLNGFDHNIAPTLAVGAEKYVTPALGFGVEARTAFHARSMYGNIPGTFFDATNIVGLAKLNIVNLFDFDGTRKTFEPVLYVGTGWGHTNSSKLLNQYGSVEKNKYLPTGSEYVKTPDRNYQTFETGLELNFNLGKEKAWALTVNGGVQYGGIQDMRLDGRNAHLKGSVGLTYHFKTSNGTRHFNKFVAPAPVEVIKEVPVEKVIEHEVIKEVIKEVPVVTNVSDVTIAFAQGSAVLTDAAKALLDNIASGTTVNIDATASPEGGKAFNQALSTKRADAVASYLKARGVNVATANGKGVTGPASQRIAIVSINK